MDFDITKLQDIFAQGQKEEESPKSANPGLTPASFGSNQKQILPHKDIPKAKPFASSSNATEEPKKTTSKDIWGDDEDNTLIDQYDPRERPDVKDTYVQMVGAEDIFLGMGTKDPGTTSSDGLRMTFHLPKEKDMSGIELDVTDTEINLSTPNYVLRHILPRSVNSTAARAKWCSKKSELTITVPLNPGEFDFLKH